LEVKDHQAMSAPIHFRNHPKTDKGHPEVPTILFLVRIGTLETAQETQFL
jgi:hypothetical protein